MDTGVGVAYISILLCNLCWIMMVTFSSATVVLEGINTTLSFQDSESNFAPSVEAANGVCGKLYIAEPLNSCSSLTNKIEHGGRRTCTSPFALIVRGACSFEDKVRRAQDAGFEAVIVYDNMDNGPLIAMAGNSAGIEIPAVFISKAAGEKLTSFAGLDMELWILPDVDDLAWSIMAISFISLLAMSAVLATCFFVRRHRIRRERPNAQVRQFHGMSSRLVKAMPTLIFAAVTEDNCTSSTCAICLEDYSVGDRLRILPCHHKFHAFCVDAWLTSWRTFCPVCKRDARSSTGEPPASESTPLLSSNPSSAAASPASSFRSRSSAIWIISSSPHSYTASRDHWISGSAQISLPLHPCHHLHSPTLSVSRSSLDSQNMSQRLHAFQSISPHSLCYSSSSPLNTRYMSSHLSSPSSAASNYPGSSYREVNPLYHSEFTASFSPYASAKSLPGC